MSKHTPGPWIFYADMPSVDPAWHLVTTANKMRVLANVHIEPGNAADEANARLIAAAPELLGALSDMLGEFDDLSVTDDIRTQIGWSANTIKSLQRARAAIAKATA
jgi:hypothetical protein